MLVGARSAAAAGPLTAPVDNDLRNSNGVAAETRRVYKFSSHATVIAVASAGALRSSADILQEKQ